MRQVPNGRRPRGRHHSGGHGGGDRHGGGGGQMGGNPPPMRGNVDNRPRSAASLRHQNFDSNCIDLRVRGNAWQVHEKYQALARDAQSSGDRVAAENYLQHAEHYFRIIEAINEATAVEQHQRPGTVVPSGPPGGASGGAPVTFAGQPETPTNYYGAAGAPPVTVAGNPADGNVASSTPPQAQAEVQVRNPPPNPFFAPDESEGTDGPQSLVARR
jgi:hypothetical protein